MSELYNYQIKFNNSKEETLNFLKGSPFIVVNIATKCGFTPQLEALEEIYNKYKDQGLKIIGIPTNDFGGQTPEENEGVQEFCQLNFGVSFLVTQKESTKGAGAHPIFKYIVAQRSGLVKKIMWNFEKFLFDKEGNLVDTFRSTTSPSSKKVLQKIESLL